MQCIFVILWSFCTAPYSYRRQTGGSHRAERTAARPYSKRPPGTKVRLQIHIKKRNLHHMSYYQKNTHTHLWTDIWFALDEFRRCVGRASTARHQFITEPALQKEKKNPDKQEATLWFYAITHVPVSLPFTHSSEPSREQHKPLVWRRARSRSASGCDPGQSAGFPERGKNEKKNNLKPI